MMAECSFLGEFIPFRGQSMYSIFKQANFFSGAGNRFVFFSGKIIYLNIIFGMA